MARRSEARTTAVIVFRSLLPNHATIESLEDEYFLRVIAGQYRGRKLKSPPSLETRPTSDRLRETLFNVLAPRIQAARFLDLCAGSGAVGIEALSRGAVHTTFVDSSRQMGQLIEANLNLCRIDEAEAQVMIADAGEFLRRQRKKKGQPSDVIFFDPPYADDYLPVLQALAKYGNELLHEDGLLIVEHHHKTQLPETVGHLSRYRVLKQGDSALSFYFSADYAD